MKIKSIIILIFLTIIVKTNIVNGQELWQLQPWAVDSSYVIGALSTGEPVWVPIYKILGNDSLFTEITGDTIFLKYGKGFVKMNKYGLEVINKDLFFENNGSTSFYTKLVPDIDTITTVKVLATDGMGDYDWYFLDSIGGGGGGPGSTIIADGYGINVAESPANTWTVSADTAQLATQHDISGFVPNTRTISTTAPLSGGGDLTSNRTFSMTQANGSTNGWLSSTDWNTFINKFTLPALTNGSVLFSNGTTIAQDNANFFWNNTTKRLGIGTASPTYALDVVNSDIQVNGARVGLGGGNIATNIAFGNSALNSNTTGTLNVAIGQGALASTSTINLNTAIGWYAMNSRTAGANNLAIGSQAMRYANTGADNVAIGSLTLTNVTGSSNIGIGTVSGNALGSGSFNTMVGSYSGTSVTTGSNNTYLGYYAGGYNTTGTGNICIGYFSGYLSNTSNILSIDNTFTTSPLIGGQLDNNRVGINNALNDITRTLDVNGDVRIRGAILDNSNSSGTSGQVLTSQGTSVFTWTTPLGYTGSTGYVPYFTSTSAIAASNVHFNSTGFGFGTTSATHAIHLNNQSIRLQGNSNIVDKDNSGGADGYILTGTGGTGLKWRNPTNGITATSTTIELAAQALAFHNLGSNGIVVRTGAAAITSREIVANTAAGEFGIKVTNGTGVSGNPGISFLSNYATLTGSNDQTLSTTYTKYNFSTGSSGDDTGLVVDAANDEIDVITTGTYEFKYSLNCKSNTSAHTLSARMQNVGTGSSLGGVTNHYFNNTSEYCHNNSTNIFNMTAGSSVSLYVKTSAGTPNINNCNVDLVIKRID